MKAKYKIGTLVKVIMALENLNPGEIATPLNTETHFSEVEGVVTRKDGFQYQLANGMVANESEIVNAYRPMVTRESKPRAKKAKAAAPKKETKSAAKDQAAVQ